ncbi:hypothetical protein ACIRD2_26855 [Streptomyces sp. NPDC093595]|uniref:hypothetical protein n=1 Tax=Streptomyces sp. NPDC093595 TaxID=3366045 RepID=UPI0038227057
MDGDDFSTLPGARDLRPWVARFVAALTERNRLPLDYTVASLRLVDLVVDGLRREQPDRARVETILRGLGAYTGEVVVRRAGACWIDFDEEQRAWFGQPVGIRMPDGRAWNPLGKVANRFEAGPEESVQRFYLLLHGRAGRKVAAVTLPGARTQS